ncbi:MAG: hypothetical protein DRP01_03760 [Archaeoglobales archaeon]|nr:MAG: hypothetical protein DRP01_03760 [Archaeoglobales archaeon]
MWEALIVTNERFKDDNRFEEDRVVTVFYKDSQGKVHSVTLTQKDLLECTQLASRASNVLADVAIGAHVVGGKITIQTKAARKAFLRELDRMRKLRSDLQ